MSHSFAASQIGASLLLLGAITVHRDARAVCDPQSVPPGVAGSTTFLEQGTRLGTSCSDTQPCSWTSVTRSCSTGISSLCYTLGADHIGGICWGPYACNDDVDLTCLNQFNSRYPPGSQACDSQTLAERCDGVDNNSNGIADENCAGDCCAGDDTTNACSSIGACSGDGGIRHCDPYTGAFGGIPNDCNGQLQTEECDGIDNNCNGLTDEGVECPQVCENKSTKPVDLINGTLETEEFPDFTLEDPVLPIRFWHRWSQALAKAMYDTFAPAEAALGIGWWHPYMEHLRIPLGGTNHGQAGVGWFTPEGAQRLFPRSGSGWASPRGRLETLTYDPTNSVYTLTRADGSRAFFEVVTGTPVARLKQLARGPVTLTARYYGDLSDSDCMAAGGNDGRLCKLASSNGRTVILGYTLLGGTTWRLQWVKDALGAASNLVGFEYSASQCPVTTRTCGAGSLCCVKRPVSASVSSGAQYEYTSVSGSTAWPPLLGSVFDADGTLYERHYWEINALLPRVYQTESRDELLVMSYAPSGARRTDVVNYRAGTTTATRSWSLVYDRGRTPRPPPAIVGADRRRIPGPDRPTDHSG